MIIDGMLNAEQLPVIGNQAPELLLETFSFCGITPRYITGDSSVRVWRGHRILRLADVIFPTDLASQDSFFKRVKN